ncbi:Ulp1 protease family, C-terminal catalytic domain [Sesbania bispinosa]|nr:Ulp1 protease family, C-terminal catalytic domain [Sesbania bispinosa]
MKGNKGKRTRSRKSSSTKEGVSPVQAAGSEERKIRSTKRKSTTEVGGEDKCKNLLLVKKLFQCPSPPANGLNIGGGGKRTQTECSGGGNEGMKPILSFGGGSQTDEIVGKTLPRVDISQGQTNENIGMSYVSDWMHPYSCLKYIYVPIKENTGHWYLMVVSMEEEVVYHLDYHPQVSMMKDRRDTITKVCEVLVHLMTTDWIPIEFLNKPNHIDSWEIKGITPNQENNMNSAIWVLEWMAMDFAFQPNVHEVINENKVHMKTAMTLLLGTHNELRKNLEAKAEIYFQA